MRIFWHNIIALILLVVGFWVLARCWSEITTALTSMNRIGPGHSVDDKVTGLIALGLAGAVLVAVVRILSNRNGK